MIGIIIASGLGTRMRPITYEIPKAMLPVGGIPVFIRTVRLIRKVMNKREKILYNCYKFHFFSSSSHKALGLIPFKETRLWGSGGAIKKMQKYIQSSFENRMIVIYGDVLTEVDLEKMLAYHKQKGGIATVGVTRVNNPELKGILQIDKDNKILEFEEKPKNPKGNLANAGVYIFEDSILKYIPNEKFFDIGKDLLPILIKKEKVFAYHIKEFLIDIGDFASYEEAIRRYRHVDD